MRNGSTAAVAVSGPPTSLVTDGVPVAVHRWATPVSPTTTSADRPTSLLFGPTSPTRWGPITQGPHTVLWSGSTGDPHGAVPDTGLLRIGVDEVLAAAADRLTHPSR